MLGAPTRRSAIIRRLKHMDRHTIVTKTAKGLMEASGRTSELTRELRGLLKEIDGKSTVGSLALKLGSVLPAHKLIEALERMQRDGFVRAFASAPQTISPPSQSPLATGEADLDFTGLRATPERKLEEARRQQAEAEDIARQAAATRAREAARERANQEAVPRGKSGQR